MRISIYTYVHECVCTSTGGTDGLSEHSTFTTGDTGTTASAVVALGGLMLVGLTLVGLILLGLMVLCGCMAGRLAEVCGRTGRARVGLGSALVFPRAALGTALVFSRAGLAMGASAGTAGTLFNGVETVGMVLTSRFAPPFFLPRAAMI
jgi:hypothetical protein